MSLWKIASENMMKHRANISSNKNFIIAQHYPGIAGRLIDEFVK